MNHREYAQKHGVDLNKKDIAFELANLITEARLYAGLSQEQLAERIGSKQESISRAESGRQEPSVSFLEKVAKAVGTELIMPRFKFMKERDNNSAEI